MKYPSLLGKVLSSMKNMVQLYITLQYKYNSNAYAATSLTIFLPVWILENLIPVFELVYLCVSES